MEITGIDLYDVRVPLNPPFYPSWIPGYTQHENRHTIVKLTTKNGLVGLSSCPSMAAEAVGIGPLLGSYLLGERADDIANIRQRVREIGYLGCRVGWIECACWDIIGKNMNKPVHELLSQFGGGTQSLENVKLYCSTGEAKEAPALIQEVNDRATEGFKAVKIRVHGMEVEEDTDLIRKVREGVESNVHLAVDANQGWRVAVIDDCSLWDLTRARTFCECAGDLDYLWVEEPLANDLYDDMATLKREMKVPIAGGEMNRWGIPEFRVMLEKDCLDIYQPDATLINGLSESWKIMKMVEGQKKIFSPHTWSNGIDFAINLQLYAASGSSHRDDVYLEYPRSLPGWESPEGKNGLFAHPYEPVDGLLKVPMTPGLGIEIPWSAAWWYQRSLYSASWLKVAARTVWDKGLSLALGLSKRRNARLAQRSSDLERLYDAGENAVTLAMKSIGE